MSPANCNWCNARLRGARYRVYCTDGDKLDYCCRDHAELDSSAGPKFRNAKIRKVPPRVRRA